MFSTLWSGFALAAALSAPGAVSGNLTVPEGVGRPWVVYVEKGPAQPAAEAGARREIAQRNSQFEPVSAWVRSGDALEFINRDNIYHNVFSPTRGTEFDLGLYRGGVKKTVEMRQPGEVDVYCNIHPEMHAKVLVVPTGQAAEAGADGSYSLPKLPPGSYTLVAWSASLEPVRRKVEVKAGETARADFSLKPRAQNDPRHLNKNGEQYGRYK